MKKLLTEILAQLVEHNRREDKKDRARVSNIYVNNPGTPEDVMRRDFEARLRK